MLTREQLRNGTSFLPFEEVDVPEFGGTVGVRGMTAGDAISYQKEVGEDAGLEGLARIVVRSVVDKKLRRVFGDDEWESLITGDKAWPLSAINRVALVAMRLNRSAEGNSEATPDVASSSD